MIIGTDGVNAYCYAGSIMLVGIIHHGVRQHDHDVTSRRRVCSSDDEPKVSLLLIEEE
jgi:hypothetical protein